MSPDEFCRALSTVVAATNCSDFTPQKSGVKWDAGTILTCFYQFVGAFPFLQDAHAHVMAPSDERIRDNVRILCLERQQVSEYGIKAIELGESNPNVWAFRTASEAWEVECNRLSTFLISLVGWQTANSMPVMLSGDKLNDESTSSILSTLTRIGVPSDDQSYHTHLYTGRGLVLCHFPHEKAFIAGIESEHHVASWEEAWGFSDFDML